MKLVFGLLFFLISSSLFSQTEVTWKELKIDSFVEVFSEEFQAVYRKCVLNELQISMDGKNISISGFILPVNLKNDIFYVLIESDIDIEDMACSSYDITKNIEIKFKTKPELIRMQRISLSGKLRINKSNIAELGYILEDAEIIE